MDRKKRRRLKREQKRIEDKIRKESSPPRKPDKELTSQESGAKKHLALPASIARRTWQVIGAAALLFGAWVLIRPDISAQPDVSLDPPNPFSEIFTVSNNGNLPLYGVRLSCLEVHVLAVTPNGHRFFGSNNLFSMGRVEIPEIGPKTGTSAGCRVDAMLAMFGYTGDTVSAVRINIVVSYRPPLWFRREKHICFDGAKDSSGIVHWIHCPDPD